MPFTPFWTEAIPNRRQEISLDRQESSPIWAAEGEVTFALLAPLESLVLFEQRELLANLARHSVRKTSAKGKQLISLPLKAPVYQELV